MKSYQHWLYNIAIALDQFGNAIAGGDPDETISSRLGKLEERSGGKIGWNHPIAKIISSGLDAAWHDHCINSIETDEGKDEVLHW
jgi:hypothetical protein